MLDQPLQPAPPQHPAMLVLRWIGFLPAAAVAASVAWIAVGILGRIGLSYAGVESGSFIDQLYFATTGHGIMGGVFVLVGTKVAPAHRIVVAYVLAGLSLLLCGFALFPALIVADAWAIVGAISTAIGSGLVLYAMHFDASFREDFGLA